MFYVKLALVLLLCIPVVVLGFFLFSRLVNQVFEQANREKEARIEREKINNTRMRFDQKPGRTQKR
ncbi:MAG: hypothetical protein IJ486_10750 [Firmicutes bacterium]|nr:hypothetical protein [Bacillota bacterium]